jgi:hypothetical protein
MLLRLRTCARLGLTSVFKHGCGRIQQWTCPNRLFLVPVDDHALVHMCLWDACFWHGAALDHLCDTFDLGKQLLEYGNYLVRTVMTCRAWLNVQFEHVLTHFATMGFYYAQEC